MSSSGLLVVWDRGLLCPLGSDGGKNGDWKEGREWRFPGLFYADDLVLYGKSEIELRAVVGHFVEV